jgi:hypothetical protein
MAEQTVAEVLTAAIDSVTVITDINTKGKKSIHVGGTAEQDTDMSQVGINGIVQRNVDHLETILEYTEPNVKGASDDKTSYTGAVTTGKAYIAAN